MYGNSITGNFLFPKSYKRSRKKRIDPDAQRWQTLK